MTSMKNLHVAFLNETTYFFLTSIFLFSTIHPYMGEFTNCLVYTEKIVDPRPIFGICVIHRMIVD